MTYKPAVLKGFEETYDIILKYKKALLAKNSPLIRFKKLPVRVVLRDTIDYASLLDEHWHPVILSSIKRRNQFISLPKTHYFNHVQEIKIGQNEMRALKENNIPYFSCLTTRRTLYASQQKIKGLINKTGYAYVVYHLKNRINRYDLALQRAIINNSYEVVILNSVSSLSKKTHAPLSIGKPVSSALLQQKARSIAKRELHQLYTLYMANKNLFMWPTIKLDENDRWVLGFAEDDLYEGIPGIVLTFAYGAHVFKNKNYKILCQAWLKHIKLWLRSARCELTESTGFFEGLGGYIYVLTMMYQLWGDKSLLLTIKLLINKVDMAFKSNQSTDVISGSAGLLMVLLSANRFISSEKLMKLMQKCAKHILHQYPDPYKITKQSPHLLLGMAHGVSGMILALHRYNLLKKSQSIQHWLDKAMLYLDEHFNSVNKNWPDLRYKTAKYSDSWCHGAPGIGLMLLALQPYVNVQNRIDAALTTTFQQGIRKSHCLCHGNLGSLDFFLMAVRQGNDKRIELFYKIIASNILSNLEKNSNYYCDICTKMASPGLLTGQAGVVYELLRILSPDQVPSILS
jgi:type 2 lantibiotic biosynthesis protein LanM